MTDCHSASRVLVTAGAAGIGRSIAEAFLADGAEVHICDIDESAIQTAVRDNPGLRATVADVGNPVALDRLFSEIEAHWGGLDVLVNNAGIGGPRAPLELVEDADWDRCISVNLNGAFYCTKRASKWMKRDGRGVIINIATSSARTGLPNRSPYVASKAGLIALTANSARELGPHNIRCNAVLPGTIDNQRGRNLIRLYGKERGMSEAEARVDALRFVSMRTMIDPSEVADMAVFLASDRARHVSGQSIGVCGNVEWEA